MAQARETACTKYNEFGGHFGKDPCDHRSGLSAIDSNLYARTDRFEFPLGSRGGSVDISPIVVNRQNCDRKLVDPGHSGKHTGGLLGVR